MRLLIVVILLFLIAAWAWKWVQAHPPADGKDHKAMYVPVR